jgi:hypothetical protein
VSRTDAHAPTHVRLARGDLHAQPDHALVHDSCDLPDRAALARLREQASGCTWTFCYTGVNEDSCLNCHGGALARARNRVERHRDRIALRVALGAWRGADAAAFDAVVPPDRRGWPGRG